MSRATPAARPPHSRSTRSAALITAVALVLAGITVFLTRETATSPTAEAATHQRVAGSHGTGLTIDRQWFGTWRTPEGSGFCTEFDKDHPDSVGGAALKGNVPGMSTEDSNRVKYVANHYGLTTSKTAAAAAAIYVWRTQNTTRFNTFYNKLLKQNKISTTIKKRVSQIAAEAALHGPYKLSMTVNKGDVGQTVTGAVTAHTSEGRAAPGQPITLTATNANVVRHDTTTNAQGRIGFSIKVTHVGKVTISAKLITPAASGIWLNRPTPGHQILVLHGRTTESATTSSTFTLAARTPTVKVTCTPDCHGTATVTVTATNSCGAAALREHIYVNGRLDSGRTIDVSGNCAPGAKSRSTTARWVLADGAVVTTRYCYLSAGRCIDTPVLNAGSVTVDCPPLPTYTVTVSCPCGTSRMITYTTKLPASSRRHDYTITVTVTNAAGATWSRQTVVTSNAQAQTQSLPPAPLPKGATATLTVTVKGTTTTLDALTEAA